MSGMSSAYNILERAINKSPFKVSGGLTDAEYNYILRQAQDELWKIGALSRGSNNLSRIYSANVNDSEKQQHAFDMMANIIRASKIAGKGIPRYSMDGEMELDFGTGTSIGVNNLIQEFGYRDDLTKAIITAFNADDWKAKRIDDLMNNNKMSYQKAVAQAEYEMQQWEILNKMGNEIHEIYSALISHKSIPELHYVSDDLKNKIISEAKQVISMINRKFPGCKIYAEVGMTTKPYSENGESGLSKEFYDVIHDPEKGGYNRISGRADIIVIDAAGEAHIFDLKVSRKTIGGSYKNPNKNDSAIYEDWRNMSNEDLKRHNYWDSTKKLMAANQLAFYAGILEQYGIKVASAGLIPIKIDINYNEDGIGIEGINDVTWNQRETMIDVPGTVNGRYHDHVRNLLGWELKLNNDTMANVNEQMNKLFPDLNVNNHSGRRVADVDTYMGRP